MEFGGLSEAQRLERRVWYDAPRYGFAELAGRFLSDTAGTPLDALHSTWRGRQALDTRNTGSRNGPFAAPRLELAKCAAFQRELRAFLRREVMPLLGAEAVGLAYQRWATFRVHLAGATEFGRRHTDGGKPYFHQPAEVNVWVPLTAVDGSNTLWAESEPGKKDFHPFAAEPDEFYLFYANQCEHYTVANDSGRTRVSFDLRVVPLDLHDDSYLAGELARRAEKRGVPIDPPFRIGGYYDVIPPGESSDDDGDFNGDDGDGGGGGGGGSGGGGGEDEDEEEQQHGANLLSTLDVLES